MGIRKISRREIGPGRLGIPALTGKLSFKFPAKIWFDLKTRNIFKTIGTQAGEKLFTGLINCETGQIHMMPECRHDSLAIAKGLKKTNVKLKDDWYGFKLACEDSVLKVSPWSNLFGLIPPKYASIFESWIRDLFSDKLKSRELKKVLFCKFQY